MKRFAIIGAGALGSVYGARLAAAGCSVLMIDPWTEQADAIKRNGLSVRFRDSLAPEQQEEIITAHPQIETTVDQIRGDIHVCIILATTYAIDDAAQTAAKLLEPDGFAVSLQNGIGNVEALSNVLGSERVIGGVSYTAAQLMAPGQVMQTRTARTCIGELDSSRSSRLDVLSSTLAEAGLGPEITDNIAGHIWTKLITNCAINPISAITHLRHGEIVRQPELDALQTAIIEEAVAVAKAQGIKLLHDDMVDYLKAFCRPRYAKASMAQHVDRGGRTEIDALNGAVVRQAAVLGLSAPANTAVTALVKGLEISRSRELKGEEPDFAELERRALSRASN